MAFCSYPLTRENDKSLPSVKFLERLVKSKLTDSETLFSPWIQVFVHSDYILHIEMKPRCIRCFLAGSDFLLKETHVWHNRAFSQGGQTTNAKRHSSAAWWGPEYATSCIRFFLSSDELWLGCQLPRAKKPFKFIYFLNYL